MHVITSYSIHYTKLYDVWLGINNGRWGTLDELNTENGQIIHHRGLEKEITCRNEFASVSSIFNDNRGNVWICAWNTLVKYSINSYNFV